MKGRRVGIGRFRLTMEKILSLIILTILGFRQKALTEVNLSIYKQITARNEKGTFKRNFTGNRFYLSRNKKIIWPRHYRLNG